MSVRRTPQSDVRRVLWLVTALAGCSPVGQGDSGTQIGEEGDEAICDWVVQPMPDASTPAGNLAFSADDFLATSTYDLSTTFNFDSGDTAAMTLSVVATGATTHMREEPRTGVDPASSPTIV